MEYEQMIIYAALLFVYCADYSVCQVCSWALYILITSPEENLGTYQQFLADLFSCMHVFVTIFFVILFHVYIYLVSTM